MKNYTTKYRSRRGYFFQMPNELFGLHLTAGEIAVYAYLMYLEDRKTYQCYPSYAKIGKAVHMSANTVRKYVQRLEDKRLIYTEPTTVMTSKGEKRNGSLLYTIRPIQDAVDYYNQRQLKKLELQVALDKANARCAS